jgi:hypothetical protein
MRMAFAAEHESRYVTFRTSRDVRLESVMHTKTDVRQRLWIYEFTP